MPITTPFEQFIFIYFISATALAGFAVLWRNWLHDHPSWHDWLGRHFNFITKALTCGSCFTLWLTLFFVLALNPLGNFFIAAPFASLPPVISYLIQWMSLGWSALFLRFLYVKIQETVSSLVHDHRH